MRRWLASVSVILAMATVAFVLPSSAGSVSDRPYGLKIPAGHDGGEALPLVLLLHGYTSNGQTQADYFGLPALADKERFLLAYPDGTRDRLGNRFWNATDACCDFFRSGVDDVAYLDAVLDDIATKHPIDTTRVFVVGHSNGAFMAHRYACDRAGRVAAIVTLAGMQWKDESNCRPGSPVSELHVHGRHDVTVRYDGGAMPNRATYPGAVETVGDWAASAGCTGALALTGREFDLDRSVIGDETVEHAWTGCPAGIDVGLWTIEGGGHVPAFDERWAEAIWSFVSAHPKAS